MSLTSQPVNCPLFKLLKGDICSGRRHVEVESVGVRRLLCCRVSKLAFSVVNMASFRVNSIVVLSEHLGGLAERRSVEWSVACVWRKNLEDDPSWGRD